MRKKIPSPNIPDCALCGTCRQDSAADRIRTVTPRPIAYNDDQPSEIFPAQSGNPETTQRAIGDETGPAPHDTVGV